MGEQREWTVESAAALGAAHRGACAIASGNGLGCVRLAMERLRAGDALADCVVAGVGLLEDDPSDVSVGYGGLPNAEGVVECDACVMDGATHGVGAVGALRSIRHASRVALEVMRRLDHSLIVGEGALAFARACGFEQENLLTPESRAAWERWRARGQRPADPREELLSDEDRWDLRDTHGAGGRGGTALGAGTHAGSDAHAGDGKRGDVPFTTGTVHCSIVDARGDLASCTTTSGLSWKHPGRIGDSPIVGAGIFCDNDVGAAGATGRGEACLDNCAAHAIVSHMARGATPTDACLETLRVIARRTHAARLVDERGRPRFNVTLYALRKDGAFGSAAMYAGYSFAIATREGAWRLPSAWLFERPAREGGAR